MDNPVFLDEEIPFVQSDVYEIDETTDSHATTLEHDNLMSLNHQTHHSMWTTVKCSRRPKSTTVVMTNSSASISKAEPKRRGRKPKQESLSLINNNNILSESTEKIKRKQRCSTLGVKLTRKVKNGEKQQQFGKFSMIDFFVF